LIVRPPEFHHCTPKRAQRYCLRSNRLGSQTQLVAMYPTPRLGEMPQFLLKSAKQALPLIMLCGVSLRFNVLDGALLGSVSDKRGP
jgi:hypothetical protein